MKYGLVCPGYNSQFVGMAKELYDECRIVQEYFEEAAACLNVNFVKLCFASSDKDLSQLFNAYASLVLVSTAVAKLIEEECGITYSVCAGESAGFYSALCVAGGITFPDTLYFIGKLSAFYSACLDNRLVDALIVSNTPYQVLHEACLEHSDEYYQCFIAGLLPDGKSYYVVGDSMVVEAVKRTIKKIKGQKAVDGNVFYGAHAPICTEFEKQLKLYLPKVDFHVPTLPVVDAHGKILKDKHMVEKAVLEHIFRPFEYNRMYAPLSKVDCIIIPSPSKILYAEMQKLYPRKVLIPVDTLADVEHAKKIIKEGM